MEKPNNKPLLPPITHTAFKDYTAYSTEDEQPKNMNKLINEALDHYEHLDLVKEKYGYNQT